MPFPIAMSALNDPFLMPLVKQLNAFRRNKEYCDILLIARDADGSTGEPVHAHRIVLDRASVALGHLMDSSELPHVFIDRVTTETLNDFVALVYSQPEQEFFNSDRWTDRLIDVLLLAKRLQCRQVLETCCAVFQYNVTRRYSTPEEIAAKCTPKHVVALFYLTDQLFDFADNHDDPYIKRMLDDCLAIVAALEKTIKRHLKDKTECKYLQQKTLIMSMAVSLDAEERAEFADRYCWLPTRDDARRYMTVAASESWNS